MKTRTFAVGIEYITEHTHQRALALAGNGFEGGVAYATAPGKAAWVHTHGVSCVRSAAYEMSIISELAGRCKDPVYHLILAYAKNEHPTREQVIDDAKRLLGAVGMKGHQYVLS